MGAFTESIVEEASISWFGELKMSANPKSKGTL